MKKIKFEKFKIAKLEQMSKIIGGTDDGTQQTVPPPKCKETSTVWEEQ
jgi:hypothetical protein